jgi:hypothetical protein
MNTYIQKCENKKTIYGFLYFLSNCFFVFLLFTKAAEEVKQTTAMLNQLVMCSKLGFAVLTQPSSGLFGHECLD